MNRSYIWSLPTRVFHWSFVLLIVVCYLTEDDDLIIYHAIAGYALLLPLTFRLGWGLFGPKYSLFKDFPLNLKKTKEFAINIFDKEQKYIGHNPIASFIMIAILIVVPIIILTGGITLGAEESKGLFSSLNKNGLYEDLHEFFANFLYVLIFAHLAGIAIDKLLHNEHGTLNSIFNGYKNSQKEESIKLNIFQKIFALIFFILSIFFTIYLIFESTNPFIN